MDRPKRPCAEIGCNRVTREGRCEEHAIRPPTMYETTRGNATDRGYDSDLQKFRKWFKAKHPTCQDCKREGRTRLTKDVHHIQRIEDRPDLRLEESNCVGLCRACHNDRHRG